MRSTMPPLVVIALLAAGPLFGQITSNPIPAPIEKRGIAVEIKDQPKRLWREGGPQILDHRWWKGKEADLRAARSFG